MAGHALGADTPAVYNFAFKMMDSALEIVNFAGAGIDVMLIEAVGEHSTGHRVRRKNDEFCAQKTMNSVLKNDEFCAQKRGMLY